MGLLAAVLPDDVAVDVVVTGGATGRTSTGVVSGAVSEGTAVTGAELLVVLGSGDDNSASLSADSGTAF